MKSMVRLTTLLLNELENQTGISTVRDIKTVRERSEKEGLSFLTITLPQFEKDLMSAIEAGEINETKHFRLWQKRKGSVIPSFMGDYLSMIFSPDGVSYFKVGHYASYLSDVEVLKRDSISKEEGDMLVLSFDHKAADRLISKSLSGADVPLQSTLDQLRLSRETSQEVAMAIRSIRQIALLHSKVEMECKACRIDLALEGYKDTDKEIKDIPKAGLLGLPMEPFGSTVHTCWKRIGV